MVKTYDLTLIGWVTTMAVRARTVFMLVALSWEPYSKSSCCYGNEGRKELKMKLYVVVCYGMIFVMSLFCSFYSIGCVHPNYAEARLELGSLIFSSENSQHY